MHMPLSEHEKRLLAQMEEALAADDPRLVSALTGSSSISRNRVLLAIALLLGGIATLFAGLVAQITAIGLGGFLVALTGSVLLFRAFALPGAFSSSSTSGKGRAPRSQKGLGDRLQDRWDQRRFEE
jgi:hypothetical protein